MTDANGRSRVSSGVPAGGEFAAEARTENPDLAAKTFVSKTFLIDGDYEQEVSEDYDPVTLCGTERLALRLYEVSPDGTSELVMETPVTMHQPKWKARRRDEVSVLTDEEIKGYTNG